MVRERAEAYRNRARSDVLHEDRHHRDETHLQLDGYSSDSYGEDDPITASAAMAA
ncbi:hypothetical protein GCM10010279_28780 [Streptomyces mutabilis]|nr:hypothetical protein GCM10010279_28780 [Streptomyces mutabilis]